MQREGRSAGDRRCPGRCRCAEGGNRSRPGPAALPPRAGNAPVRACNAPAQGRLRRTAGGNGSCGGSSNAGSSNAGLASFGSDAVEAKGSRAAAAFRSIKTQQKAKRWKAQARRGRGVASPHPQGEKSSRPEAALTRPAPGRERRQQFSPCCSCHFSEDTKMKGSRRDDSPEERS